MQRSSSGLVVPQEYGTCPLRSCKTWLKIRSYRVKVNPLGCYVGVPQYVSDFRSHLLPLSLADQKAICSHHLCLECPSLNAHHAGCSSHLSPSLVSTSLEKLFHPPPTPTQQCSQLHEYSSASINMHLFIKQSSLRTEAVPGTELSPGKQK